jgi:uncharacterized delta-60 repeat protein
VSGYHPYGQVTRVLSNGSLDYSFGDSGVVNLQYGGENFLNAIKMRSDGKYVVMGTYGNSATMTILNHNGSVDSSILDTGYTTVLLPGYVTNNLKSFYLQPDNKLIVCGWGQNDYYHACSYIARLNEDGTYDTTFNHIGIDSFNFGVFNPWLAGTFLYDVKPGCGNEILAVGGITMSPSSSSQSTFVVKLRMDDTSSCTYTPTLGQHRLTTGTELVISPNPVVSELHISGVPLKSSYSVLDAMGSILTNGIITTDNQSIDLHMLHTGCYTLRVTDNEGNLYVRKIVKL